MTSTLWKKLNLKDERQIAVLNAPESFEAEINALSGVRVIRDLAKTDYRDSIVWAEYDEKNERVRDLSTSF